jgi:hypothetical protein
MSVYTKGGSMRGTKHSPFLVSYCFTDFIYLNWCLSRDRTGTP